MLVTPIFVSFLKIGLSQKLLNQFKQMRHQKNRLSKFYQFIVFSNYDSKLNILKSL